MATLFDIVNVQNMDGVRAAAARFSRREAERRPFVFFFAGIAQLEERSPRKAEVGGSIPPASTKFVPVAQPAEAARSDRVC